MAGRTLFITVSEDHRIGCVVVGERMAQRLMELSVGEMNRSDCFFTDSSAICERQRTESKQEPQSGAGPRLAPDYG